MVTDGAGGAEGGIVGTRQSKAMAWCTRVNNSRIVLRSCGRRVRNPKEEALHQGNHSSISKVGFQQSKSIQIGMILNALAQIIKLSLWLAHAGPASCSR